MTHPLHITYVAPFGLGQKTTVWARILPLARQMVARGHRASIVIPPWDTPNDAGKRWVESGVPIINSELSGGLPAIMARVLRLIHQQQPQIVHIIKPRAHAGLAQWWLWQKRSLDNGDWILGNRNREHTEHILPNPQFPIPKIILDIDDWEQAWAAINPYPWPVARFLAWQEEWGIRHADAITAASRWLVDRAQAYSPQMPVLYLPNGIEESEVRGQRSEVRGQRSEVRGQRSEVRGQRSEVRGQRSEVRGQKSEVRSQRSEVGNPDLQSDTSDTLAQFAIRNSQLAILFFTRFVEVEPRWLVEFWQVLSEQLPTARLLVAGNALQAGRAALFQQQMAQQAPNVASQVEWLGYVPREQLEALYPIVRCAIFPAQEIPLLQAKCSVKLATTLLHGVPVVASAVGEQAAYGAKGAALLVDPAATPAQFAQAVITVLQQPEEQRALVERARQHLIERYRWADLAGQLEAFYQATLQRR